MSRPLGLTRQPDPLSPEAMIRREDKVRRGLDPDFHYPASRFASAAALQKNIPTFIQTVGLSMVAHLLLTFGNRVSVKEARRALNNAWRRFFPSLFGHAITIVEFTKSGRVHFHILVQCQADILTGFDHDSYVRYKLANESAFTNGTPLTCRQRRAMRDALPANDALRTIWRMLDEGLRDFGFGSVYDLFPIQTNEVGISRYLAKQFFGGLPFQDESEKGARLISYSRGCPRVVPPGWRPPSKWFEARLTALLRAFSLPDRQHLKERLGRRWAFGILQLIDALEQHSRYWQDLPVSHLALLTLNMIRQHETLDHYLGNLQGDLAGTIRLTALPHGPTPPLRGGSMNFGNEGKDAERPMASGPTFQARTVAHAVGQPTRLAEAVSEGRCLETRTMSEGAGQQILSANGPNHFPGAHCARQHPETDCGGQTETENPTHEI